MSSATNTLRRRLLRLLWWPLLSVLVLAAAFEYGRALERARDEQDLALRRVAIALASRLDLDADDMLDDDIGGHLDRTFAAMQQLSVQDHLAYLVLAQPGRSLAGEIALQAFAVAGASDQPVFADHRRGVDDLRVISYPHASRAGLVHIVVAETTRRRDAQARQVLVDTLVPNALLMALALVLVRVGVGLAMRPVDALSQSVLARTDDDLSPLPERGVPGELLPLVGAINLHMKQLKAAAAAQQAFLSNAAHQLRTPLAGVTTQLELAARAADPAQGERLAKIGAALQRMTHTTHQMLALARSGPQSTQADAFEPVELSLLLEEAASQWFDPALAAGVDLGFDAQTGWVQGSPWMLNEALGNLIANALRHSAAQGRVTVHTGTTAGAAWLSVEDDGPGIPVAERDKVLNRFYQAPGAARGGSGLGLAIVREVALRHGAQLRLEDACPGAARPGLRVSLCFPPCRPPTPAGAAPRDL